MTDDTIRPGDDHPAGTGPSADVEARLRELLQTGSQVDGGADALAAVYSVRRQVRAHRVEGGVAGLLVAGLVTALVIVPGAGGGRHPAPTATRGGGAGGTGGAGYQLTGALTSFGGCPAYLSYMKTQGAAQVGPYGLQPYDEPSDFGTGVGISGPSVAPAGGLVAGGATVNSGVALPGAGSAASGATSAGGGSGASSYSQTDDQVAGVDEPDTVKTNGQIVVTLDGPTLRVLDSSAQVVGSINLTGDTGGGFLLDGDQAVVFSSPDTTDTYGLVTPVFGSSSSSAGTKQPAGSDQPVTAQAAVVDLSNPADPVLERTFLFDGTITAARLVGQQIRVALDTDGPDLDFVTPATAGSDSAATAANRALIAQSTLDDWLPTYQVESPDGATTARSPLSPCQSVARPANPSGLSTVSIFSLDPASATPGPGTSVVAAGQTVYATADRFYVAGPADWSPTNPAQAGTQEGCCTVAPPAGATTAIYAFDTPVSGPPTFVGAGQVPGWLIDSYALDEDADGRLRVASTTESSTGDSQSLITVFQVSGGALTQVGQIGGLGAGEFVRAVRFIGDDAYVVTFETYDPLYVVDLSDPAKPTLVGQLDQPGFSEFLYPLPDNRLLGVGVSLTDNEPSGLVVATYDVSNPAHPTRISTADLADGPQFTDGYDPHAFLYWAPLDLALVAAPNTSSSGQESGSVAAFQIGATGSLNRTATLSHGTDSASRSLVIDGQVWVITSGGVITSELTDLPASTWHGY